MATVRKRKKKIYMDPAESRELARELSQLERHDYNDWELTWFDSMLRRHPEHIYSEKEFNKLLELQTFAQVLTSYDGASVQNLVRLAYFARLDLHEDDPNLQWIVALCESGATSLLKRELARLVEICKDIGVIPR
jgi:hypothetical protein